MSSPIAVPTPAALAYRLLGPLQVTSGGRPVVLPGSKPRAVLAVLAIGRNSVVAAGPLITAVWNDNPPPAAASGLQVAVSAVRRAIRDAGGGDPLQTAPPGYRLSVAPGALDLDRFLALRDRARGAAGEPGRAAGLYREALDQWTGEPLADLQDLRFAADFAAGWNEERLATLGERIACDLSCGRHDQLIGELRQLTAGYPLRESLWAQLILALYRSGRQAEALDAARRLRAVLADELGIDPSPDLQRLEHRVLQQDPGLVLPTAVPVAVPAGLSETMTEDAGPARGVLVDAGGRRYPITARGLRIGRQPDNDVVLDDGKVSRAHAVVVDAGSRVVLTDLTSTNGTFVNGQRVIGSTELRAGDQLTIGGVGMRLELPPGDGTDSAPVDH